MKNLASIEKLLKKCFKEKYKLTTATVVAFLITGTMGYGADKIEIIEENIMKETNITENISGNPIGIDLNAANNNEKIIINSGVEILVAEAGTGNKTGVRIMNAQNITLQNKGTINLIESEGRWLRGVYVGNSENINILNIGNIQIEGKSDQEIDGITATGSVTEGVYGLKNLEILNKGNIITKIEEPSVKLNLGIFALGENVRVINKGTISVEGGNVYGIRMNGIGEQKLINEGTIKITTNKIDANGMGIEAWGANSIIKNHGSLLIEGGQLDGIYAVKEGADILNTGLVSIKNSGTSRAIHAQGENSQIVNEGRIELEGNNLIGISVAQASSGGLNSGTISLNVFSKEELKKEELKYSGNIAMQGQNGATISSTGTIQLSDITVEKLRDEKEMQELEDFVNETLMVGGTHTGIITNFEGKTILAAGDLIEVPNRPRPEDSYLPTLGNLEEGEVKKSNDTLVLVGEKLDGVLNIGEKFEVEDGKFLAKVKSEELSIGGTINSGNANGIEIGEGNTVNLTGTINSGATAVNLEDGATLVADGASIKGDITSTGNSDITLENGTKLAGDILLGEGDDNLTIDSTTGNLLSKETIIDGGEGKNTLNLGTSGKVTTVASTISNFENKNLSGVVVLESEAKIESEENSGNIILGEDSLLVVRVSGDENHAFTDIGGNTVTTDSNGKIMLETNNLDVGTDGKAVINLAGTKLDIAEENIIASQYIYDITFAPVKTEGSLLNVSVKSLDDMGINSKYQGAFDSIVTSGNLSEISNSTALGKQSVLENLLGQVVEMNPYALSTKMSRDSIMGWNNGLKSLRNMPEAGEWMVQATGTGNYENYKGAVGHESNTTGILATAEYGITKDTSLGFAFGGGKQTAELKNSSSDLDSDTFYVGAFAKKNIENFRILGSLGYQRNKFDAKRTLDNGLDRFSFDKSFDTDGFSAMLETRYVVPVNETLSLEPKFVLDYTYISQDGISEGEKAMGINVDSQKQNTYGAEVGVDLVKSFSGVQGQSGKMYAGVAYGYTGGDTNENLEARIGNGSKFEIDGVDMGNSRGKATVGVELNNGKGFNYGVGYTYEAGKDTRNSKVTLGFGYKF